MDRITDRIYLGDINGCSNLHLLRKNKITHILTMAAGIRPLYRKEFKYKVVNIMDLPTQNILAHFDKAIEFINKAVASGGRVLVHCFAGVSRSASTVIAYFMVTRRMSFQDAFSYVQAKRPIIFPNFGFQRQLKEYEKVIQKRYPSKQLASIDQKSKVSKLEVKFAGTSTKSPAIKKNKFAMLDTSKAIKPSQDVVAHQLKPKQFHYPSEVGKNSSRVKIRAAKSSYGHSREKNRGSSYSIANIKSFENSKTHKPRSKFLSSFHEKASYQKLEAKRSSTKPKAGIQKLVEDELNRREESKHVVLEKAKHTSKGCFGRKRSQQKQRQTKESEINMVRGNKILKTYYDSNKRKQKEFNIKTKKSAKELQKAVSTKPPQKTRLLTYNCQFCGQNLFDSRDIQPHESYSKTYTQNFWPSQNKVASKIKFQKMPRCNMLFIAQKDWITEYDGNTGRILCPRKSCSVKLGSYSWAGLKCYCGVYKSPAFQIDMKAITEVEQSFV
ncbi:unnamed protein product [Moneuplotes crassus]|uniref:Protein-tyrosine-phosphatase n=1 Tax=Euplotes crassus TaxID=5936 RepID=A0AAD1UDL2_EUPCR|nr:unnamed protein product [Moneuplotes crassus]